MLADSWRCSNEFITHQAPQGWFNSSWLDCTHQHDTPPRAKAPLRTIQRSHELRSFKGQGLWGPNSLWHISVVLGQVKGLMFMLFINETDFFFYYCCLLDISKVTGSSAQNKETLSKSCSAFFLKFMPLNGYKILRSVVFLAVIIFSELFTVSCLVVLLTFPL